MNVQLETSKLNEATNFQMIEVAIVQQPFSSLYDNLWVLWKLEKNCNNPFEKLRNPILYKILTVFKTSSNDVTNDF